MISNPYEVIKQAHSMPETLQNQEELSNTSLDHRRSKEMRRAISDAYIDNRLRSDKPITFLEFIDDLRKLWEAAGNKGKIIRQNPLKEKSSYPTITYRLLGREINDTFKDIKPRYRTTIRHPDIEGEFIELYGQVFDIPVEFCVYSTSAEEADELVIQFEDFLQTYAGFFKRNGVQEILFKKQKEDEVINEGRVYVSKRTLIYTLRFEKIVTRFLNEIEQIAIQAKIFDISKEN